MAAGLGFKTFTTGEVLTAADTNGYLMQGVLVFASAAARDAAITSPQEGQCCYLKDTDAVLTYSGTAWVGFDDSNAIQNAIVDAKGDLIAASAADTPARLAVGANGETLVADSSTSSGLRYQAHIEAGKNFLINGGYDIWQRGTTFSNATSGYTADRWTNAATFNNVAISQQTTGAPNGSRYYMRLTSDGASSYMDQIQLIETANVAYLRGKTVTFSILLRKNATVNNTGLNVYLQKSSTTDAGTGATWATIATSSIAAATITTGSTSSDWYKFSLTGTIPNDGTANSLRIFINYNGATANGSIYEYAQAQLEIGSVATEFSRAGGTIQGELAACQRYFQVIGGTTSQPIVQSYTAASAFNQTPQNFPVQMRVAPTATKSGTWAVGNTGQPSAANLSVFGYSLQTQKDGTLGTFYFYPDSADDTITFSAEL